MNRVVKFRYRWMILNDRGELIEPEKENTVYTNNKETGFKFLKSQYDSEEEAVIDMDQFLYRDWSHQEYILVKSFIFYNRELAG